MKPAPILNRKTNGLLQAARGVGALAVALWAASLGQGGPRGRLLALGAILTPFLLIAFASVRSLEASLLLLVLFGGANILLINMSMTLVQSLTSDKFRGRVMGLYSLVFFGFQPLGSLWIGSFAEQFGEPKAVIASALAFLVGMIIIWRMSPALRRLE